MTSRWADRIFRRSTTAHPARPDQVALTTAFLDMDKRQSIADSAVQASEQLHPEWRLGREWESVADLCYQASAAYLAVSGPSNAAGSVATPPSANVDTTPDAVLRQLTEASRAVDGFYDAHRVHLEGAVATLAAVPALAQQAVAQANAVRLQARGGDTRFIDYPSVQSASRALDSALSALDSALAAGGPNPIRDAAGRVRTAAASLEHALAQAPEQDRLARQAVASVRTRLSAVRTRAERLAPAFSSLLREFNAASSADLTENGRTSQRFIDRAEAGLVEAQAALAKENPEHALTLTASVRSDLSEAEHLVDAVTDRLILLRDIRTNPRVKEDEVRFKLRDAQMLAVSRGIVKEWASVLDAQVERIDRISGQLNGRNPDYWAYVSGLDAVATFISGVVNKMRNQPAKPRQS